MLSDEGISGEEVVLLKPSQEGTEVINAASIKEVSEELKAGFTIADSVIPYTKPSLVKGLSDIKL